MLVKGATGMCGTGSLTVKPLGPENGYHIAGKIFKCSLLIENYHIQHISQRTLPNGPTKFQQALL